MNHTQAYNNGYKNAVVLYFGDHDPSGIDMIRDVKDRISEMLINGAHQETIRSMIYGNGGNPDYDEDISYVFKVKQLALNMQQIRQYRPPENPAKIKDPMAKGYIEIFGNKSWELDALRPEILARLCKEGIEEYTDMRLFRTVVEREASERKIISDFSDTYGKEK